LNAVTAKNIMLLTDYDPSVFFPPVYTSAIRPRIKLIVYLL